MFLSIVIPAYNVEQYIARCLDSCLNQNISSDDYEIIVIDDGSTDDTLSIIKDYGIQNKNIKYYSRENHGLSITRNEGLSKAQGTFIWFVDSDDWIAPNCLASMQKQCSFELDILQLRYCLAYEDGDIRTVPLPHGLFAKNPIQSGINVLIAGGLPVPAQFSLYRRDFLLQYQLRFVPHIYHEDSEFKPRATYYANKISVSNQICYYYFQRKSGNIMSTFRLKNGLDILFVMESLHNFSINLDTKIKKAFGQQIGLDMNTLIHGYNSLNIVERKVLRNRIKNKSFLFHRMIKSGKLKYLIEGVLLRCNVTLVTTLYKLYKK